MTVPIAWRKSWRQWKRTRNSYNFDGKPKKDKAGHAVFMFDSKGANQALTTICRLRGKFRDKLEVTQDVSDRANRLAQILAAVEKDEK